MSLTLCLLLLMSVCCVFVFVWPAFRGLVSEYVFFLFDQPHPERQKVYEHVKYSPALCHIRDRMIWLIFLCGDIHINMRRWTNPGLMLTLRQRFILSLTLHWVGISFISDRLPEICIVQWDHGIPLMATQYITEYYKTIQHSIHCQSMAGIKHEETCKEYIHIQLFKQLCCVSNSEEMKNKMMTSIQFYICLCSCKILHLFLKTNFVWNKLEAIG